MKVPVERQACTTQAFDEFLSKDWPHSFVTHPPPEGSLVECVIVEPRPHRWLVPVLRNVSAMLPHAALTVMGSRLNVDIVARAVGPGTNVRFVDIGADNLTLREYSALLCSPELYEALCGRHLLFFQTDTGVRTNRILRFLEFDYVGAPWDHVVAKDPKIRVGNGGLSLRRRDKMLDIVRHRAPDHAAFEMMPCCGEPEDTIFTRCLYNDGSAVLPDEGTARAFSVEALWHDDPMGFHQPHLFWEGERLHKLLGSCDRCCDGGHTNVQDAWLEMEDGTRAASADVRAWVRLGVSAAGICIPPGSLLPGCQEGVTSLVIQTDKARHACPVQGMRVSHGLCLKEPHWP